MRELLQDMRHDDTALKHSKTKKNDSHGLWADASPRFAQGVCSSLQRMGRCVGSHNRGAPEAVCM